MARTASYTDEIKLTAGAPVAKPKTDTAPDLKPWIEKLTEVDRQTRQANRTDISIPFNVPADKTVKTEDSEKVISAAKTVKLRFQQAAAEMGIGVSISIQKLNAETNTVLVSTMARRQRKDKGAAEVAAPAPAAQKPAVPSGLPKPAVKR